MSNISISYNGFDITQDVDITSCILTDSNGGKQDYCTISFANGGKIWQEWQPQINDTVNVKKGHCDSGKMYINDIQSVNGGYSLILLSTPTTAKKRRNKVWRKGRLSEIINDVANRIGFKVQKIGFTDRLYETLTQTDETDVAFLDRICALEGYNVKIFDGNIIIYNERLLKGEKASGTIVPSDTISSKFDTADVIYNCVSVKYYDVQKRRLISYTATENIDGESISVITKVDNQAQAERFARNIMYNKNKFKNCGCLYMKYADVFASGSVVDLADYKGYNGKWYIYESTFDLVSDTCILSISKIEGANL